MSGTDYWRRRLEDARRAYEAGDWDELERQLGISQPPDGPSRSVEDIRADRTEATDD
jgi:hypothetical protein